MAPGATEKWMATQERRLRDQQAMVRRGNPDGVEIGRTSRDEDYLEPMFVPGVVLVETRDRRRFERVLDDPRGEFVPDDDGTRRPPGTPIPGLLQYRLPVLRRTGRRRVTEALEVFERELPGRVSPEYYLHVSPGDHGRPCPATEPEETGLETPWPRVTRATGAGAGVKVTVVDTGWCPEASRHSWLAHGVDGDVEVIGRNLHEYSGHGTFVAGVVRCRAPEAEVRHERFDVIHGGAIRETAIIRQLRQAVRHHTRDGRPHVINLSAGSHTLDSSELMSFKVLWERHLSKLPDTILVAAAGNDATDAPFYPAAFGWAVGVGSLDRKGRVSNFSNHGVNADVYAVGRNHVNAFPDGRYVCKETPDKGDVRIFQSGLARWSGTSFASPLVAGLLAAEIGRRPPGMTATAVKDAFLAGLTPHQDPEYGAIRRVPSPYA